MSEASLPLVSVIVPVFNVEAYLDECISSIRAQSYPNLEILVVEDCSTDGSLQLLQRYLLDRRVQLLRHDRNRGLSAARNTGIEAATGEFVVFVDSDDVIGPTLVEICVNMMQREDFQVLLYQYTTFNDDDPIPSKAEQDQHGLSPRRFVGNEYFKYPHFAWLKFMRADLLRDNALRFPEGLYYEDWLFHWELGFQADNIRYIPQSLYYYRLRRSSITGTGDRKLFHIYSANLLVGQVVGRHDASETIRTILATKIVSGAWYVISKIQLRFLGEAITHTRRHLDKMRALRRSSVEGVRFRLLCALLSLPMPLAFTGILTMRLVSQALSSLWFMLRAVKKPVH